MAISALDVDVLIGTKMFNFQKISLKIEDASKAAKSKGRPNGSLRGAVSADGEAVVTTAVLKGLLEQAASAGSFQEMEAFDMVMNVESGNDSMKVEAFGCKFKISDLIDADTDSEDEITHTLPYYVTGKEFVNINGVPYARSKDIERLQ